MTAEMNQVAERLVAGLKHDAISLLYYPHPFTRGGFVVVHEKERGEVVDLIAKAYQSVPPDFSLHCLRRAELFELALPVYSWLPIINNHMHVSYCLKHRGTVLHGIDLRTEVSLPSNSRVFLDTNIAVCMHFLRTFYILNFLMRREYQKLIETLDLQIRYLMAAALLLRDVWDVSSETVPETFAAYYSDARLSEVWEEFRALTPLQDVTDESSRRQTIFKAVWLFETFLKRLREYTR